MQGELHATDPFLVGKPRNGMEIGHLKIMPDGKNCYLVMGNHTLEGAIEPLKKPLIVVKKTNQKTLSNIDPLICDDDGDGDMRRSEVLQVEMVVKRKAVFKARARIHVPKELIRHPAPVKKKGKK